MLTDSPLYNSVGGSDSETCGETYYDHVVVGAEGTDLPVYPEGSFDLDAYIDGATGHCPTAREVYTSFLLPYSAFLGTFFSRALHVDASPRNLYQCFYTPNLALTPNRKSPRTVMQMSPAFVWCEVVAVDGIIGNRSEGESVVLGQELDHRQEIAAVQPPHFTPFNNSTSSVGGAHAKLLAPAQLFSSLEHLVWAGTTHSHDILVSEILSPQVYLHPVSAVQFHHYPESAPNPVFIDVLPAFKQDSPNESKVSIGNLYDAQSISTGVSVEWYADPRTIDDGDMEEMEDIPWPRHAVLLSRSLGEVGPTIPAKLETQQRPLSQLIPEAMLDQDPERPSSSDMAHSVMAMRTVDDAEYFTRLAYLARALGPALARRNLFLDGYFDSVDSERLAQTTIPAVHTWEPTARAGCLGLRPFDRAPRLPPPKQEMGHYQHVAPPPHLDPADESFDFDSLTGYFAGTYGPHGVEIVSRSGSRARDLTVC